MTLERLYQDIILDHNRAPRNFGSLEGATHSARGRDALCGDDILIELVVEDGKIRKAAFSGEACAVTKASASMLTEWLAGRGIEEISAGMQRFETALADPDSPPDEVLGELGYLRSVGEFPARVRNALLPWKTVLRALEPERAGARPTG